jgi:hypothetical protein
VFGRWAAATAVGTWACAKAGLNGREVESKWKVAESLCMTVESDVVACASAAMARLVPLPPRMKTQMWRWKMWVWRWRQLLLP